VEISIVQGDALGVAADVLVVKYAGALYGVDAQLAGRLAANALPHAPIALPAPGEVTTVETHGLIGAASAAFVGVPSLHTFGYADIRAFARRALAVLAERAPHARVLAFTLHGVGFGLDETEAFRAELAGFVEALQEGLHPAALQRIVVVDRDAGCVQRLQRQLAEIFPHGSGVLRASTPQLANVLQADALRTAGADSGAKPRVFVAMPFAPEFDDRYHYGIHAAVRAAGYLCERSDQASFTGDVLDWVRRRIDTAELLVADLTGANPNVYLEVGYAWGRKLPTVLLASQQSDLRFDVQGQRCLVYGNSIRTLEQRLTQELHALSAPPRR